MVHTVFLFFFLVLYTVFFLSCVTSFVGRARSYLTSMQEIFHDLLDFLTVPCDEEKRCVHNERSTYTLVVVPPGIFQRVQQ